MAKTQQEGVYGIAQEYTSPIEADVNILLGPGDFHALRRDMTDPHNFSLTLERGHVRNPSMYVRRIILLLP